ncbi:hypothetical protein BSKO_03805 [Bryopsis sp. KO-2023]|nr:hypothetical protein BSKO_03805 [Bryopsis sp. KO-2023]
MTTSDATGERVKRRSVPSYMKPTATSKLKENVYGVDQRFTLTKSKEPRCVSPDHHELDYIPPPPPPPGVPSFMRPTKTWGGKVSDKDKRPRHPRSKIRRRASCNAAIQSTTAATSVTTSPPAISTSFEPTTPSPGQTHLPSSPTSNGSSVESTCTTKPKTMVAHPPIERRRSSYCLAPRPSIIGTFDEIPFIQSRPSTLAEAIKETLIRTAPASDSRNMSKLDCMVGGCTASTAVGPPTPTLRQIRSRRKELPRYMRPTVASKARLRE